ncbi:MAG: PLP-dependent aspartate aminotransferase family protein [Selenomonadales bacterium]|nr:PLP-dependent aspartate aminotransferase family protein [Selenomonadales bacterium]MDD7762608.1 PLP-dependent aspartate aminotransferase family protein [Selenomonadales bacterium]
MLKDYSLEVHGRHKFDATGAISTPIHLSATYRHPGFKMSTGYDYGRVANPTRDELENIMCALERGERAWAVSSGMAAINLVLQLFKPGDHILLSEDLYGGTVRLADDIYSQYGIDFEYVNTADTDLVKSKIRPATRGLFIETPSNPMMLVSDIAALAELAHANNAMLIVDNTFLSPHFQKPLTLGADIVVHSGTKYLCGHNDIIAGFVIVKAKDSLAGKQLELFVKSEGPNLAPIDSWLMLRSIKTLGIRVERQAANAIKIAKWLKEQPMVTDVYYVGLAGHPGREIHRRQSTGDGSMISFKVKTADLAKAMLGRLKLICFAESLGGVESLLTYPIAQTHAEMPAELLAQTGLDDRLLRLSVGIEDVDDLLADLAQAMSV